MTGGVPQVAGQQVCPGSSVGVYVGGTEADLRVPKVECSGHGSCHRTPPSLGTVCRVGDTSCYAICDCEDGWSGAACDTPAADMDALQGVTSTIVASQVRGACYRRAPISHCVFGPGPGAAAK